MAAIDKMYLKDYYVFDDFRRWCLIHKPFLLNNFYYWLCFFVSITDFIAICSKRFVVEHQPILNASACHE